MADQLPAELDFDKDRDASPDRMNRAMSYLLRLYSTVAALRPDYEAAIAQIQTIGLQRLTEALQPVFLDAEAIGADLAALRAAWLETNVLEDLQTGLEQLITDLGDELRPRLDAEETATAANAAALAKLATDRWFHNHGF